MTDISLRKWAETDSDNLTVLCNKINRSYISDRIPFPYTKKDADLWLNHVILQDSISGIFRAIELNNTIIGSISIEKMNGISKYDSEIGYMIDTDFWNMGVATTAVRQACNIAFNTLDILRITGKVYHPNIASNKVLTKNKFVLEGTLKNAVSKETYIYDMLIYARYK